MIKTSPDATRALQSAWRWLKSPRLALALLVGLVPIIVLGTVLPQEARFNPSELAAWADANPFLADLAETLDLYTLYTSWWFLTLLALLVVNTFACTLHHIGRELRFRGRKGFAPPPAVLEALAGLPPLEGEAAAERALTTSRGVLEAAGFRVSRGEAQGRAILWGRKGLVGGWGSIVFHASLVLIFVGAFYGGATLFTGYVELIEGESFEEKAGGYFREEAGAFAWREHTGVRVDLVRGGWPTCEVALSKGGETVLEGSLALNDPLTYEGFEFYIGKFSGPSPIFSVVQGGEVRGKGSVFFALPRDGSPQATRIFPIPGSPFQVRGTLTLADNSMELEVRSGARQIASGRLEAGESLTLGPDLALRYERMTRWVGIKVVQDDGIHAVYLGFVLSLGGLVMMLLSDRWQLWVEVDPGGSLKLGGHARRSPAFFAEALERIRTELASALTAAATEENA